MMKAFSLYSEKEIHLRQLLAKLQNYGSINCSFEKFTELYNKWHLSTFKGLVNTMTAIFREDWFKSFVNFLANEDI